MRLTFSYNNQTFVKADVQNLIDKVPDSILLEEVKKEKIQEVKQKAGEHINFNYPVWKQSNDLSDKEKLVVELVYLFSKQITADDLRIAVADIISGNKTFEDVLLEYGEKVGFIEVDANNLPLFDYTLQDGSVIRANINGEYIDNAGIAQTVDFTQVISKVPVLTAQATPELIDNIKQKAQRLIEITQRILWKDKVREQSNQIEEEIQSLQTIDEVLNYRIQFTV